MNSKELLKLVADKTVTDKHEIPNLHFDYFGWAEGEGIYVKEEYQLAAAEFSHIDMVYDRFDWQNGVGLFGIIGADKILNNKKYLDFAEEWIQFHLEKGIPPKTVNTTIPYYAMLELYRRDGKPEYRAMCEDVADFVMCRGVRADEGALEHTVLGIDTEVAS